MVSSLNNLECRKQFLSVMNELLKTKDNFKDLLCPPPQTSEKNVISPSTDSYFITLEELHKVIWSLKPVYLKYGQEKCEIGNGHINHLTMKCATAAIFPRRPELDGAFISRAELEMAIKLIRPAYRIPSPKTSDTKLIFSDIKNDIKKARENLKRVGNVFNPLHKTSFYEDIQTKNGSERTIDEKLLRVNQTSEKEKLDNDILRERFTVDISSRLNRSKDKTEKKCGLLSKLKFWKPKRKINHKNDGKIAEGHKESTKGERIRKETATKKKKSVLAFISCVRLEL